MLQKLTIVTLAAALSTGLWAQTSDIIVFSEAGEKFTLLVDGDVKNAEPAVRVMAQGIRNQTPKVTVNFQDATIPSITQNAWLEYGLEYTMVITTNRKGVRVLRQQGQAPLGTTVMQAEGKPAPVNFQEDAPVTTTETIAMETPAVVQSTTTVVEEEGGGGLNMSIDLSGVGMNVAVTDGTGSTTTRTTTTTTTTTTSSVTMSGSGTQGGDGHHHSRDRRPDKGQPEVAVVTDGCGDPMPAADFEAAKKSIQAKGFEETKATMAKQITGSNCLSADQVKTVMGLFGFEATKLDFAKFAYDHVSDRKNFYKVNDAFGFSSSVDELNEYIQGR